VALKKVLRENIRGDYTLPIKGPLGVWTFPILNTIVIVIQSIVQVQVPVSEERRPKARTYNIVRDEHGRIVSIEEIWVE